jgi:hypothetical protein
LDALGARKILATRGNIHHHLRLIVAITTNLEFFLLE